MIHVVGFNYFFTSKDLEEILSKSKKIFCTKRFWPYFQQHSEKLANLVPIEDTIRTIKKDINSTYTIIASGDPLFFGIGKRLLKEFYEKDLFFHPALTTVQLVSSRFKIPWDDMKVISLHGRNRTLIPLIKKILKDSPFKVGVFTDNEFTPDFICSSLLKIGLSSARVLVAQDIGGENEAFFDLDIKEAAEISFHPLNFMIFMGEHNRNRLGLGLPDDFFLHERGLITKSPIRTICLSKLNLPEQGVLWDIGAGSGSISIEASLMKPGLNIFSVEKDEKRISLIEKNRKKTLSLNVEINKNEAPEGLDHLPNPDRIFVGGGLSKQGLLEYLIKRLKKDGILVATTILLESLNRLLEFCKRKGLKFHAQQIEIREISPLGKGHMAKSSNPITVFTIYK